MKGVIFRVVAAAGLVASLLVDVSQPAAAVPPTISAFAGTGVAGNTGDGGPALTAKFDAPTGIAADALGNVYIADYNDHRIRKVSANGTVSTIAGDGTDGLSGDGGSATSAQVSSPMDLAVDSVGNVYFTDFNNAAVRKVSPSGIITKALGTGNPGFSGDGGAATSAEMMYGAFGLAVDMNDNLFVVDSQNSRVRKVTPGGTVTTVAGTGSTTYSGDGGAATSAGLGLLVSDVAVAPDGSFYIADGQANVIRKVSSGGTISLYAGTGVNGTSGDGGLATAAQLTTTLSIVLDAKGSLYVSQSDGATYASVREISADGYINRVVGDGTIGDSGDGGPATSASFSTTGLMLAMASSGDLYLSDAVTHRVRKVTAITSAWQNSVLITARVAPALTFTVNGRGTVCNGQPGGNFQTGSTSTAVAFGRLSAASVSGAAQNLSVTTNAANGFSVSIRTTGTAPNVFRDGSGHTIADVSGTWASPGAAPSAGTAGFGYTTSDASTPFTANTWAKVTTSGDSAIVATAGTMSKSACVGFAASISTTTAAASYSAAVVYTAIPSF